MRRIFIANRGEIAMRIARTARRLGYQTVGAYSHADREAEFVRFFDIAAPIGGQAPSECYLDVGKMIAVAKRLNCQLVHPGYGFLSERPQFVNACNEAGLVFIGPGAECMETMGDKIRARQTVDKLKVPRVPGSPGAVASAKEALEVCKKIGFPVLLKAAAGGGGKGMRRVDSEKDLESAFEGAAREAQGAFGDKSLYVEKLILRPHHVEIQVFGDGKGGSIHLGERECSVQRRHQKVWEETPAPILKNFPETREALFKCALKITSEIRYAGAGTLEFIVDEQGGFYFLEMNTRLQVEHPVTEWVTGVDLVEWQILLADGKFKLPEIPERRGAAIEVRVYAEDPIRFLPSPGKIASVQMPSGPFVRVDTAFTEAGEVSMFYDPMIAKISVWGGDRETAVGRMRVALEEAQVEAPRSKRFEKQGSLQTNLTFLRRLVRNKRVMEGDTTTDLIESDKNLVTAPRSDSAIPLSAALAVSLGDFLSQDEGTYSTKRTGDKGQTNLGESIWLSQARKESVKGP